MSDDVRADVGDRVRLAAMAYDVIVYDADGQPTYANETYDTTHGQTEGYVIEADRMPGTVNVALPDARDGRGGVVIVEADRESIHEVVTDDRAL